MGIYFPINSSASCVQQLQLGNTHTSIQYCLASVIDDQLIPFMDKSSHWSTASTNTNTTLNTVIMIILLQPQFWLFLDRNCHKSISGIFHGQNKLRESKSWFAQRRRWRRRRRPLETSHPAGLSNYRQTIMQRTMPPQANAKNTTLPNWSTYGALFLLMNGLLKILPLVFFFFLPSSFLQFVISSVSKSGFKNNSRLVPRQLDSTSGAMNVVRRKRRVVKKNKFKSVKQDWRSPHLHLHHHRHYRRCTTCVSSPEQQQPQGPLKTRPPVWGDRR